MKRLVWAVLLAVAGLGWSATRAVAQPGGDPRMQLVPSEVELSGPQTVVELTVASAPASSGFSVDVLFDGDHLAVTGVELGPWPGSSGRAVQPLGPTFGKGRLALGALMVGEEPAPEGDGVLARITFAALGGGDTLIELENPTLVGADSTVVPVSAEGASVAIAESPPEPEAAVAADTATALAAAPGSDLVDDFVAAVEEQATIAAPGRAVVAATAVASFTPVAGGGQASSAASSGGTTLVLILLIIGGALFVWAVVRRGA